MENDGNDGALQVKTHAGRCVAQLYIVCDTEKYNVHQRGREMDGFPNPLDIILQCSQTVCPWGLGGTGRELGAKLQR